MDKSSYVYIMTNKKEKAMKKWNRNWKIKRIEDMNPDWEDLYFKL